MELPETFKKEGSKAGTVGWALLGAGVVAWDIFAPETLSSAVDRALEHKTMRYVAIGGVALVGAHLLNIFPEEHDPIILMNEFLLSIRDERRGL
jgi:hypothetical protein